jgi:predicted HD superfamily hydrolase involved in NAD metabolism
MDDSYSAGSGFSACDLDELVRRMEEAARARLSPDRCKHSGGCAQFAATVCSRLGMDPRKGLIAGWAHDLAKELPARDQLPLARACPVKVPETVFTQDILLHGPAAATMLAREFGVRDPEILEAVALHTVGRADMGPLAKIVWAADKMEVGRRHVDDAFRQRCLQLPPDELLLAALEATIAWLRSKGREVAPETLDLYNALRKENE